jgi:GT2 family glycosyltransferase
VLVHLNSREEAERQLRELRAQEGVSLELVAVDNASTDGTADFLAEQPDVRLLANAENRWLSPAWAQGVREGRAPYVLLLTSDLSLPQPDAVATLKRALDERPGAGMAGPRLVDEHGTDSLNGSYSFPTVRWMVVNHLGLARLLGRARRPPPAAPAAAVAPKPVGFVNGAAMLVRREALEAIGGIDERYKLYWEEIDLAHRLRDAGWEVLLVPSVLGVHPGKGTPMLTGAREEAWRHGERLYFRRHHGVLGDALVYGTRVLGRLIRRRSSGP